MKKIILLTFAFTVIFSYQLKADNEILVNYSNIAEAKYKDALILAKEMHSSIEKFMNNTNESNFIAVKDSWLKARTIYQQTEVFRFGNPLVDDWEGKVNAWPLDEGLIDYVDNTNYYPSENDFSNFNVIANKKLKVEGELIDASVINPKLLSNKLHEIGGNEANVATGYHAIEFLLWGQDLNGNESGSGNRPYTDFDLEACTNDNCDRRREYLVAASQLLIEDLQYIQSVWSPEGQARLDLLNDQNNGLKRILIGMGSLSYGELAGERMKLGLMLHDPEEEHDCFSDNTHNSHYYNVVGINNVFLGKYKSLDGKVVSGPSISSLLSEVDNGLNKKTKKSIKNTLKSMKKIVISANKGVTYDMLIAKGNEKGNQLIQNAVDSLIKQSKNIELVAAALNINNLQIEGSDSLDNPDAVFN
jgi:putative iron-regulated protein